MGRERIRDHCHGNRAVAIDDAIDGARLIRAAAGSQGQDGEQKNSKKRNSFTAIHVAPTTE